MSGIAQAAHQGAGRAMSQPGLAAPARTGTMVVVLGMHRSGTSSLTGTLAQLGAALPQSIMPAQMDNPAGFYESAAIVAFNDALLRSAGTTWDDWRAVTLPDDQGERLDRATGLLGSEFGATQLAVIKDPRMCRLLPFWQEAFRHAGYQALFVIPLRHPFEVARSLEARNRFPLAKGVLLWLRHMLDAERETRGCPRSFVSWPAFLDDWRGQAGKVGRDLGIKFRTHSSARTEAIDAYLDRSLRHHDTAEPIPDWPGLEAWATAAYETLLALVSGNSDQEITARIDSIEAEFSRASQTFAPLFEGPAAPGAEAPSAETPGAETPGAETPGVETGASVVQARVPGQDGGGEPDPATKFVHDCIRKRLRADDDPLVTSYADKVFQKGWRDHTVRTMETLRLLQDRNLLSRDMVVAETGSLGDVGEHLIAAGYACGQIDGDLRYEFRAPSGRYDLLLSLEVVEHLKDQVPTSIDDLAVYDGSGVRRFAQECWRVVKPGGTLMVTTPNACSLFSLVEILEGRPPMLWRSHVREYTVSEITQLFEAAGFQLVHSTTWFAYHFLDPEDVEPLARRYLDPAGASRENRGDEMCFVFAKPIEAGMAYHKTCARSV